jgi:hypothetical protein
VPESNPAPTPTDADVLAWMRAEVADGSYRDPLTGEAECTQLAEAAAEHFDRFDWLDDELATVWDLAIEAFDDTEEA